MVTVATTLYGGRDPCTNIMLIRKLRLGLYGSAEEVDRGLIWVWVSSTGVGLIWVQLGFD